MSPLLLVAQRINQAETGEVLHFQIPPEYKSTVATFIRGVRRNIIRKVRIETTTKSTFIVKIKE